MNTATHVRLAMSKWMQVKVTLRTVTMNLLVLGVVAVMSGVLLRATDLSFAWRVSFLGHAYAIIGLVFWVSAFRGSLDPAFAWFPCLRRTTRAHEQGSH